MRILLITFTPTTNNNFGCYFLSNNLFKFINRFSECNYTHDPDKFNINEISNYDLIIFGGDQLFNPVLFKNHFYNRIFLISKHIKYFLYCPSFGYELGDLEKAPSLKKLMDFLVKKKIKISLREYQESVRKMYGNNIQTTSVDPALFLDINDYLKIIQDFKIDKNKEYSLAYYISNDYNKEKINEMLKVSETDVIISTANTIDSLTPKGIQPEQILSLIYNCKDIKVISFHGFLFSVLFNKKIIYYPKDNYRIKYFIKKYNIQIDQDGNIKNHEEVIKNINLDRRKSLLYLYNGIFKQIKAYIARQFFYNPITSSGGISKVLAYEVIRHGGCVYGVAWKDLFHTEYICIDNINDYYKISGSKYILAIPPKFKEIKEKLDSGKLVMFVGLPCLIKAFQQYIYFKDYPNLLLVDLLCSGIFSPKKHKEIVEKTLRDNDWKLENIKEIKHRWKDGGKSECNINIINFNGDSIRVSKDGEEFGKFKARNSMKMCTMCPCGTQAQLKKVHYSDITIGDAWGVPENIQSSLSKVFINSKKGSYFFDRIKGELYTKEVPIDYLKSVNG